MNIRTKVTAAYVVLIVLGVLLVSIFSSREIQKFLNRRVANTLQSQVDTGGDAV